MIVQRCTVDEKGWIEISKIFIAQMPGHVNMRAGGL